MGKTISRRALLGAGLAATLPFINPGRGPGGHFHLVRPAHAWLQVAALALSAISAFSKSGDGGLGAYLSNIKQLSEENIRLSQDILARVADLQASMLQLPERVRKVFIEVTGYQLAQQTQTALNLVLAVESSLRSGKKLTAADRKKCEDAMEICANLTGARAAPYGIGGTAASCIAMVSAVDARAHYFLGRSDAFKRWVGIAYLPWLDAMLADQDYSVTRSFLEEGTLLANITPTALGQLPEPQRQAMQEQWRAIVTSDPGSVSSDFVMACGTYGLQTSTRRGACTQRECDEPRGPLAVQRGLSETSRRALKAAEMTTDEIREMDKLTAAAGRPPRAESIIIPARCYCVAYEQIPVYTPSTEARLVARLRSVANSDGTSQVTLEKGWSSSEVPQCGVVYNGQHADPATRAASIRIALKSLQDSAERFEGTELAAYNSQRALVFTTYKLLDATRATRNVLGRIAA